MPRCLSSLFLSLLYSNHKTAFIIPPVFHCLSKFKYSSHLLSSPSYLLYCIYSQGLAWAFEYLNTFRIPFLFSINEVTRMKVGGVWEVDGWNGIGLLSDNIPYRSLSSFRLNHSFIPPFRLSIFMSKSLRCSNLHHN